MTLNCQDNPLPGGNPSRRTELLHETFRPMQPWLNQYVEAQHKAIQSIPLPEVQKLIETVKATWAADGSIIGSGMAIHSTLWKFVPEARP